MVASLNCSSAMPSSSAKLCKYSSSRAASDRAMYSASDVDVATTGWRTLRQSTAAPNMSTTMARIIIMKKRKYFRYFV